MSKPVKIAVLVTIVLLAIANVLTPFKVKHLGIEMRPEFLWTVGPLCISNTLICSWLAALVLVVLALCCRRKLVDTPAPTSLQNIVEAVFEALLGFMQRFAGGDAVTFFPITATFFLFILTSNWLSLLPGFSSISINVSSNGTQHMVPLLRGAATDLNATAALAVWSVLGSQYYCIKARGTAAYLTRYFAVTQWIAFGRRLLRGDGPAFGLLAHGALDTFVGLLAIFEELTKVVSFTFRLFGNMFGGEVLLAVMAFLMPYVASVPFLTLELFTGFIQAFIFAVLSTAFYARAVSGHRPERSEQEEQAHAPPQATSPSRA